MSTQSERWIAASRVLRRSGFGTTGHAVDSALRHGELTSFIDDGLDSEKPDPGAVRTPIPDVWVTAEKPAKGASAEARKKYEQLFAESRSELTSWWLRRMVAAERPMLEKLTFVWHNHFATSIAKVRYPDQMAAQNKKIRSMCLGHFKKFAYAMLTDAAMVRWLDGDENRKGAPNENLAREFMELFALGHGNGYTEADVLEGARALTGWVINEKTRKIDFVARKFDEDTKSVLGVSGTLDAKGFCDAVVNHPNSAGFVAERLWMYLADDIPPDASTKSRLVQAFGRDLDLRALTRAVLTDPAFYSEDTSVVVGPLEWLIGLHRALDHQIDDPRRVRRTISTLKMLGQLPFYPPSVGGWPRKQAWLSVAAAGTRLRAAEEIVRAGDYSIVQEASIHDRIDAAAYLLGIGEWSDVTAKALRDVRKDPAALLIAAVNSPEYLVV